MTMVEARLRAVRTLQASIASVEKKLADDRNELVIRTTLLQGELKKGGTTGDRLFDLIIAHFGVSDEAEALLRPLEERLKGKKGEFVLLLFSAEVPHKHVSGRGYEHRHASCYRLGVLAGEELIEPGKDNESRFHPSPISLPVPRFVEGEQTYFPAKGAGISGLKPVEVNLFEHHFGGFHKGNPPSLIRLLKEHAGEGLYIGDEAVRDALKKLGMPGLFKPAADALSKLVLELTD